MTGTTERTSDANRLGLDYRAEARRMGAPVVPIVDAHTHINGARASRVYKEVCDLYGVSLTYSMSRLSEAETLKEILGERLRFIAVPQFMAKDRVHAFTQGYLDERLRELGLK